MSRFRIQYTDPETREECDVEKEFFDSPGIVTRPDGSTYDSGTITAREWAEDWAYMMADKGPYTITELRPGK